MRWLISLLPLLAGPAQAEMPPAPAAAERLIPGERDGFVTDPTRGCWLWVGGLSDLAAGIEARWNGACPDGPAEGNGRAAILWREGRAVRGMIYDGEVRGGRLEGRGTLAHLRNGEPTIVEAGDYAGDVLRHGRVEVLVQQLIYEGALRNGVPHGPGALRGPRGSFRGTWTDGCLFLPGGSWVAFLRPEDGCASEHD